MWIIDDITALTIKTFLMSGFKNSKIWKAKLASKDIVKDIKRNKTWKHI